ncbi:9747_t:CDS:2 [Dentiscutata erythropus]|uniref:9747_t:CDS:1 n=1 Tax=Dentiscutata erythropus TaxID=1348616 RepID=A0A9N9AGP7_9GLOM|nr:9747_t:CDS:2 [Dentiscutata erythropus]
MDMNSGLEYVADFLHWNGYKFSFGVCSFYSFSLFWLQLLLSLQVYSRSSSLEWI